MSDECRALESCVENREYYTVLELRTIAAFCDDFVTELRADVFPHGIPVLVGMHTRGEYDVGSAAGAT